MPIVHFENGKRLFYRDHGPREARPVLLIHGWCATSGLWSRQIEALTDVGYRVIALDGEGHGHSSKKVEDVRLAATADSLSLFMDHIGIANVPLAIVGHSAGGAMAMATYFRHPENVACLALVTTGYRMGDTALRRIIWGNAGPVVEAAFRPGMKMLSRPFINILAKTAATAYKGDPAEYRKWFIDIHRTRGKLARLEMEEIMRYDIMKYLEKITIPTLVIGGKNDLLVPARQSEIMGQLIPDSETHILPINHGGKMFRPDLINPILVDFLKRKYSPSA